MNLASDVIKIWTSAVKQFCVRKDCRHSRLITHFNVKQKETGGLLVNPGLSGPCSQISIL